MKNKDQCNFDAYPVMDADTAQFLVDSKWHFKMNDQQFDTLCMSVIMASHIKYNQLHEDEDIFNRAEKVRKIYEAVEYQAIVRSLCSMTQTGIE